MTIQRPPITAHAASPVMKEPPMRPTPWPSQITPTARNMAPRAKRTRT